MVLVFMKREYGDGRVICFLNGFPLVYFYSSGPSRANEYRMCRQERERLYKGNKGFSFSWPSNRAVNLFAKKHAEMAASSRSEDLRVSLHRFTPPPPKPPTPVFQFCGQMVLKVVSSVLHRYELLWVIFIPS